MKNPSTALQPDDSGPTAATAALPNTDHDPFRALAKRLGVPLRHVEETVAASLTAAGQPTTQDDAGANSRTRQLVSSGRWTVP